MKKTEQEYAEQQRAKQEKSRRRRARELGYELVGVAPTEGQAQPG